MRVLLQISRPIHGCRGSNADQRRLKHGSRLLQLLRLACVVCSIAYRECTGVLYMLLLLLLCGCRVPGVGVPLPRLRHCRYLLLLLLLPCLTTPQGSVLTLLDLIRRCHMVKAHTLVVVLLLLVLLLISLITGTCTSDYLLLLLLVWRRRLLLMAVP